MTETTPPPYYEPVSLGMLCEPKYQAARVLNARLCPDRSQMAFRYRIGTPTRDASISGWRLFDWRTTPLEAACEYLERDFEGVFELDDLVPTERGIRNTRFDTYHVHEFSPSDGEAMLSADEMRQQYPQARGNFDILVKDFRALLRRPGPYLYVVQCLDFPSASLVGRLVGLLERDPTHGFQVLLVGVDGSPPDYASMADRVSIAHRGTETGKPDKFRWEGNDAAWDEIFADLALGYHADGFHDPTGLPGWAANPRIAPAAVGSSFGRPRQAASPPVEARTVWRGGAAAVESSTFWREQGARVDQDPRGALITTIPQAWTYSQSVKLDFAGIDLSRQHAWIRLEIADVVGGLLCGLYDSGADALSDEVPVDERDGPTSMYFQVKDKAADMLVLRGKFDSPARARVIDIDILTTDA